MSATELAVRMRLHVGGQLTWPEPQLGLRCSDCAHFLPAGRGKGRCDLVELRQRTKGATFMGDAAIACPQIKRR